MIIKDKKVFGINYIPQTIPVRQKLVDEIVSKLKLSDNYRLFLTGVPGNGKTISVTKALESLKEQINSVYINCSEVNSYISIAKHILQEVRGKPYNEKGKNRDEVSEELKRLMLTKRTKQLIFIFDEVDKLIEKRDNHLDILFPLINHGTASFILISNNPNILGEMRTNIQGRLSPEIKFIDVYEPGEIYEILKQRAELGLNENGYDTETLFKMAKFSSEVSGDIRFAIRLLEKTAVVTDLVGSDKISEETIKEAIKELQLSEIEKIFPTLSRHLKITILALCVNTKVNGGYAITYPDAYKNYVFNAKNEHFGAVGERQFRVYLDTLEMLGCFDFQWRSAPNRRGRVRIAIPKFDYIGFLSRFITE